MYESLVDLIERSGVPFGAFGDGISQSTIDKAERKLGVSLPTSYRWWLLNYGGGQIQDDVVYGLDEGDFGMPDILELAQDDNSEGFDSFQRLVFYIGNEESFYFDTTAINRAGEYDIYIDDTLGEGPEIYASTFADFLTRRITELYNV